MWQAFYIMEIFILVWILSGGLNWCRGIYERIIFLRCGRMALGNLEPKDIYKAQNVSFVLIVNFAGGDSAHTWDYQTNEPRLCIKKQLGDVDHEL